jgi:hypothetical protein
MSRTENDLRAALRLLEQRADRQGAPSAATILDTAAEDRPGRRGNDVSRSFPRWLPPLAAAALVAATAATAVTLSTQHSHSSQPHRPQAGSHLHATATAPQPSPTANAATSAAPPSPTANPTTSAVTVLEDAAAKLDAAPGWTTPAPQDFFYVRTTDVTTWASVSGRRAGAGRTADGTKVWVSGCVDGRIVSAGESGTCTLNDVPHYLGDAPTKPSAWDAYLEHIAPGAKSADAQGKIIVQVLHQDLLAPKPTAALLRYTTGCPGLHSLAVGPVAGQKLIGVTCKSMTNGSYGLVFDAASHAFVGFVVVTGNGQPDGRAEIIRRTGIVPRIGRTP